MLERAPSFSLLIMDTFSQIKQKQNGEGAEQWCLCYEMQQEVEAEIIDIQ